MKNDCFVTQLYEICCSDDWQAFNSYSQNEITIGNPDFVLQDDMLRIILSTKNIFNALLTSYDDGFFAHPLLYQILNFAVTYFAVYEKQFFKIVHFGIKHNFYISKRLCYCDSILQNGDIVYGNKIIGRAVVFSTTEALNGTENCSQSWMH